MIPRLSALLLSLVVGCAVPPNPSDYRACQHPGTELPACNPDVQIRCKNFLGGPTLKEGSCVHASLITLLRWQNQFELASRWPTLKDESGPFNGGEYAQRLRKRLHSQGVKHAFTMNANVALLDYAHYTRRGALLWWKPGHCCNFVGWCTGVDGKEYAIICDNNWPDQYELTEKQQFLRLWAGYGGFGLVTLFDPPSPPPYRSYERVSKPR